MMESNGTHDGRLTELQVADNTYRDGAADIANNEASFIKDGGFAIDQVKVNAVRAVRLSPSPFSELQQLTKATVL
jgi:hypothetical protein